MTRGVLAGVSLLGVLALTLVWGSSCIYIDSGYATARCERTVALSASLEPGSSFSADTGDGSIAIEGGQTSECVLTATIVAHAPAEEQAEELLEQIDVRLDSTDDGLRVAIDRPSVIRNAWFSVSLRGHVPAQTDLRLSTDDGAIRVANITGAVEARTSDGSIEARDVEGDAKLKTSDGSITGERLKAQTLDCHSTDGRITLSDVTAASVTANTSDGAITIEDFRADVADIHTNDGAIRIEYASDAPQVLSLRATLSDGGIVLVTPPGVSATIDAHTNDGSIQTELPITIRGKIGKSLQGTLGDGEGKIYLRTSDGSITIR